MFSFNALNPDVMMHLSSFLIEGMPEIFIQHITFYLYHMIVGGWEING